MLQIVVKLDLKCQQKEIITYCLSIERTYLNMKNHFGLLSCSAHESKDQEFMQCYIYVRSCLCAILINDIVTYFLLLEIIRDPNVIKYTHFPMVLSVKNHHHYSKTLLKVQYNRVLGYYLRMQAKPLSIVNPVTPFPFKCNS